VGIVYNFLFHNALIFVGKNKAFRLKKIISVE